MNRMRDDEGDSYYGGYLTLKYGAKGAVTTAYSETVGGKATATGSAQLVLLFLSIDSSNGNVYGDDVTVEDYLLEVE